MKTIDIVVQLMSGPHFCMLPIEKVFDIADQIKEVDRERRIKELEKTDWLKIAENYVGKNPTEGDANHFLNKAIQEIKEEAEGDGVSISEEKYNQREKGFYK